MPGIKSLVIVLLCVHCFFVSGQSKKAMKIKYEKVKSTDFFDQENFTRLMTRLANINADSKAKWGVMEVSQMLHHLNLAIGSGLSNYTLPDESTWMSRGFNQFMLLNVIKKFPPGTQTVAALKVTETYDFETEKDILLEILKKAFMARTDQDWGRHPYFGKMSKKQWGKLIMIHCNHHFQQFSSY